uniref:Uncharacterized protein n=1 Tax=Chenopodium quinoa TaxID=63459 RepID=A0A803NE83_CHEQI
MKMLWDEYDAHNPLPVCTCANCTCQITKKILKAQEDKRLTQFLMKLKEEFSQVRANILMMYPLSTISHAYRLLMKEERHREVYIASHLAEGMEFAIATKEVVSEQTAALLVFLSLASMAEHCGILRVDERCQNLMTKMDDQNTRFNQRCDELMTLMRSILADMRNCSDSSPNLAHPSSIHDVESAPNVNLGMKPELQIPKFDGSNPRLWIKKCCKYFTLCKIPDDQKVILASLNMIDKAANWVSTYLATRAVVDWNDFIIDVNDRSPVADFNRDMFGKGLLVATLKSRLVIAQPQIEAIRHRSERFFRVGDWLLWQFLQKLVGFYASLAVSTSKNNFLLVYSLMMAGDWPQTPYVYSLYAIYGLGKGDIGQFFIVTPLLFLAFESWLVAKHTKKRFGQQWLVNKFVVSAATIVLLGVIQSLFAGSVCTFVSLWISALSPTTVEIKMKQWLTANFSKVIFLGNGLVTILSRLVGSLLENIFGVGPVAPFVATTCLFAISMAFGFSSWFENYGDSLKIADMLIQFKGAARFALHDSVVEPSQPTCLVQPFGDELVHVELKRLQEFFVVSQQSVQFRSSVQFAVRLYGPCKAIAQIGKVACSCHMLSFLLGWFCLLAGSVTGAALYHTQRYVGCTAGKGILLNGSTEPVLQAYLDSDWGSCLDSRNPISCYVMMLGSSPLSWKSRKQPTISKSSSEAEYRALASAASEITWLVNLLEELGLDKLRSVSLHFDNQSSIYIAKNPIFHERTKHIEINCPFTRDKVLEGLI